MSKTQKNKLGNDEPELELETNTDSKSGEIEIGDPMDIRPKALPLVVKVPASASSAQKEYAKVLNAYAYQNPEKWKVKKAVLTKRLESLAGIEVAVPEGGLSINKSKLAFAFIRDAKGNEFYAGTQ